MKTLKNIEKNILSKEVTVMRKIFLATLAITILFVAGCATQPSESQEVTIGYSALRISLPVFVAVENGYFEEQGLNVNLERFDTAQPLMQALVAGTVDVAGYTALPITYNSMLRSGKELYFLTAMMEDKQHPISYFLVKEDAPENIQVADFRGKKIGVLPTIAYQKWLEVILKENGLSLDDVEVVPLAPALQPSALASGQVDALFTNDPAATTAIQQNIARKISDEALVPKYLGEPFIFGSFNIEKSYADANPEITQKVITAMDKAAKFVNENPTQAKEAMKKYLHESQQEYVQFYPDASYQLTAETSDKEFQDVANQYLEIGIIPSKIQVGGLIK
jgi:NitT/TauT family transport system substrate-binding protein